MAAMSCETVVLTSDVPGVHSRFDGGHVDLVAVSVLLFNARQFDERGARAGAVLTGNNVDGVRQRDGERQHEREQDGSKLLHCRKPSLLSGTPS